MALIILTALTIVIAFVLLIVPAFGRLPAGERLKRIRSLPNYHDGELKNISPTPTMAEGISYGTMIYSFFFKKHPNRSPADHIPHIDPDFSAAEKPKITWFGHSSYLIQLEGKNILVDPIFNSRPSPISLFGTTPFKGTDFMNAEMLPGIDLVLITHDHYDHLDYKTIMKIAPSVPHFLTSAGIGAHLESWGISRGKITELAWGETAPVFNNIRLTSTTARHFSGRFFKRNQTLWSAFILESPETKIYIGGDSGYDKHFKEIGEEHGPFDLAILECGQYNTMWPLIHMFPEEMVQAAADLKAKLVLPVHWGKFSLAMHPWFEPADRAVIKAGELSQPLTTPMMGEPLIIGGSYPVKHWWKNLK